MPQLQTISAGNKTIDLHTVRGEVVDEKKWSTTHVSGGGGSGYVHQGSGYVTNSSVTSRAEEHDQFFLRTKDGQEIAVTFSNAGLALRKGHDISLLWGIEAGKKEGPYLAVHNHTTNNSTTLKTGLHELAGTNLSVFFGAIAATGLGAVVGVQFLWMLFTELGSIIGGLIGAGIGLALAWYGWKFLARRHSRMKSMLSAIDVAIGQIRTA